MRAHPALWQEGRPACRGGTARVRGGDDTVVLHRYSARGVTLSCPIKVRACSFEGAETGSSWMMLAPAPDVTAQLDRLMTEGPGLARTCPSWIGQATSWGESGGLCHAGWTDVLGSTGTPPCLFSLQ